MTDCEISNVQYELGALDNWKSEISVTGLVMNNSY